MARQIYVNLPVHNLDASKAFFSELGFAFNPEFSDENAACMVVGADAYVMLITESFFGTFTDRPVADARVATEVLVALSAESRAEVDDLVENAVVQGATEPREPQDHGFMYGRSFEDPDGHIWELTWMDPDGAAEAA